MRIYCPLLVLFAFFLSIRVASAQSNAVLNAYSEPHSRLQGVIEKYSADENSVSNVFTAQASPKRLARLQQLDKETLTLLAGLDFDKLNHDEQIDYLLLKNYLEHDLRERERRARQWEEMATLLPFASTITQLEDARRQLEFADPAKSATLLNALEKQITATQKEMETTPPTVKKTVANRAARWVGTLRSELGQWFGFYNGYDPLFTWWNAEPYKAVDNALEKYRTFLLDKLVGIRPDDKTTIIGDPIGRDALIDELRYEMIPYTPEELLAIANREFVWCEAEMKKASREMGFGDDWKKALESVKQKHVEPGKQPELIKRLALEATDFVEKNDLLTVPELSKIDWRMEMMSPERQLQNPFFLGGDSIIVSYPTNTMTHEQKLMSMRGNNPHFAHATVFHELIPGHHLQDFMLARYRTYRGRFYTPFWMEGWALYWEFLLWDKGFHKTPEDKVGALFWRMHRCARIIFSLNFHLEKMTPQEAVDFLVERVGHERDNATAEVRRSFAGDYGPLYQVAYMMGGLQLYNLHKELVGSKKRTDKSFHDAILHEGAIPIEMVRAILTGEKLTRDRPPQWRFYPSLTP